MEKADYHPPGFDNGLIWVTNDFKKRYETIGDDNERAKALEEFMAKLRKNFRDEYESSLQAMNEDALEFEGIFNKTKERFTAVKDEALSAAYALWESYVKEVPKVRTKVAEVIEQLKPLTDELKKIEELIGKVNTYNVEKLSRAIEAMNALNGQNKEMFEFIIKNFKIETDIEKKSW